MAAVTLSQGGGIVRLEEKSKWIERGSRRTAALSPACTAALAAAAVQHGAALWKWRAQRRKRARVLGSHPRVLFLPKSMHSH